MLRLKIYPRKRWKGGWRGRKHEKREGGWEGKKERKGGIGRVQARQEGRGKETNAPKTFSSFLNGKVHNTQM